MTAQTTTQTTRSISKGESKRVIKWDILRALLIYLVVLGHFTDQYVKDSANMQTLFMFIYSFHMPCFLFLDGLFSKHTIEERRYSHIFSYLILYLFTKMLITLFNIPIHHQVTFSLLKENGLPWYGLALFLFNLMTIFLRQYPKMWVLTASILLGCFVGYDGSISDFLVLSRTIVYYPFFFLGYCTDPAKLARRVTEKWKRILAWIILIAAFLIIYYNIEEIYTFRLLVTGRNPYAAINKATTIDMNLYGGLVRLIYYAVTFLLIFTVIAAIPEHLPGKGLQRFVCMVGKHTLQIYMFHYAFVYLCYDYLDLKSFAKSIGLSNFIIIPITILCTIFLSLPLWEKPVQAIIYPQNWKNKKG